MGVKLAMSMHSDNSDVINLARQVCRSCKLRKRKCNKALPKCSLCSKRNLTCDYKWSSSNRNSASDLFQWHDTYGELGCDNETNQEGPQQIDYPTLAFLDPNLIQHGQIDFFGASMPVPAHIRSLLGNKNEIRAVASNFFGHIHLWMPFISKRRFYDHYLQAFSPSQPEIVLLFLCLKLIVSLPPSNHQSPRTSLYHAAKHFHLELEGYGVFSTLVLQAGVLLALYEVGHGIYPAAFLTIGACARYAQALGIDINSSTSTKKVLTLVEVEERRRIWWAIVILDRFVGIGSPGRPFATEDPGLDDLLPADDTEWDQGVVSSGTSSTLSAPMSSHMSRFALLCQAARLLGQVLRDSMIHDDAWVVLDRTLQSMLIASLAVDSPDNDQIAFIYSTLMALYTPWLTPTDDSNSVDKVRCQRAREIVKQITTRIKTNMTDRECFLDRDPESTSPWGLFFAYQICAYHIRSRLQTPDSELSEVVKSLKEALSKVMARWNLAGVYLQLLEAQEALNSS